eukprot:2542199-Pleurochrysis_carterae.AAC.1
MGMLDINKGNPIYFDELSHKIVPLRPSGVIYTVSQVNIKHYNSSNSGLYGGSPNVGHDLIGRVRWHCLCLSPALW